MNENVLFFKQYPLAPGQKIHIEDGPRKGDWLVIKVDEKRLCSAARFLEPRSPGIASVISAKNGKPNFRPRIKHLQVLCPQDQELILINATS